MKKRLKDITFGEIWMICKCNDNCDCCPLKNLFKRDSYDSCINNVIQSATSSLDKEIEYP